MDNRIADGTGRTHYARVDSSNNLHTRGINRTELDEASLDGRAFQCTTSEVTLTSANPSAMYFIQNGEDVDLIFSGIVINSAGATGNSVDYLQFTYVINPSDISAQNPAACGEVRVGDTGVPTITQYTGAEGATFTGGNAVPLKTSLEVNRFHELAAQAIVPKGKGIGIMITPPAGNTNLDVAVGVRFYLAPTDAD